MKKVSISLHIAALGIIFLLPISAFAHTGAGETTGFSTGFGHPLGGLDHLLAMIAVGLWAIQMGGKAVWAVPTTFVTVMILGGGIGIFGISIPYIEEGILVSVLVLGVFIAAASRFPVSISALMVGIFAIFHGHAHGTEMPMPVGGFSYSIGFALATLLLHAFGTVIGLAFQKFNVEKVVRFAGGAIAFGGIYLVVV